MNGIKLSIICVIVFLGVVTLLFSYTSANTRAADQIRIADIGLIQKFLNQYKIDHNVYPGSVNNQPAGFEAYLEKLPQSPANSNCSSDNNKYVYESLNQGADYRLTFCLSHSAGEFHAGLNSVGSK